MNNNFRIRWFEEKDSDAFLNMFQLVFEEPMSEAYFNWKYIDNPLVEDKPFIIVAEELKTGIQAGFRPCIPTRLRAGEDTFEALLTCDLMVHPDHRRRGCGPRRPQGRGTLPKRVSGERRRWGQSARFSGWSRRDFHGVFCRESGSQKEWWLPLRRS